MRVALAGNPNVGKSTVFNALTGMHQHTGNWIGKTVSTAKGYYLNDDSIEIFDLPGTYSLSSSSYEEEVARNFICFGNIDVCVVVCDAVCLEKNLNLVLQIMEINSNVLLCVNMIDEALKRGINVDTDKLSSILNIPVIPIIAKKRVGLDLVMNSLKFCPVSFYVDYGEYIDEAISFVAPLIDIDGINSRWISLKLISDDISFKRVLYEKFPFLASDKLINEKVLDAQRYLISVGIGVDDLNDLIASRINDECKRINNLVVSITCSDYNKKVLMVDKLLTSRLTGIPIMLFGLLLIFWLTIVLSNYPSDWLFKIFGFFEDFLIGFFDYIHVPSVIISFFIYGIYRVLTWVISVMLPPMLIFFPLFTILEDVGYLPRVAFTLDNSFRKCNACGKQALTMSMGFGCNAVGVSGTRIIDSARERLIAIVTNVFVPCNGRFPTIIMLISMFFSYGNNIISSLYLTLFILFSILMTFIVSFVLSRTILKGESSAFILELPPYRRPLIFKTLIRSIVDRTLIILSKAIKISCIAGIILWFLSNIYINDVSLLKNISIFLNDFGLFLGLDGAILVGFIFGFPANEIVFPIILMVYMSTGNIGKLPSLDVLHDLLISNGWSSVTAICMIVFCLFHFPCSTTILTIKEETKSFKWCFLAFLIPSVIGIIICALINLLFG